MFLGLHKDPLNREIDPVFVCDEAGALSRSLQASRHVPRTRVSASLLVCCSFALLLAN